MLWVCKKGHILANSQLLELFTNSIFVQVFNWTTEMERHHECFSVQISKITISYNGSNDFTHSVRLYAFCATLRILCDFTHSVKAKNEQQLNSRVELLVYKEQT